MAKVKPQHIRHEFVSARLGGQVDPGLSAEQYEVARTTVQIIPGRRVKDDLIVFTHYLIASKHQSSS